MVALGGGRKAVVHLMVHYGVRKRRAGQSHGPLPVDGKIPLHSIRRSGLRERMIVLAVNGVAPVTFARLKRLQ